MRKIIGLTFLLFGLQISLFAQEDSTNTEEEFDFSEYELAAPAAKAFCNNKVLGQSPTSLFGLFYNHQLAHELVAGEPMNRPIHPEEAVQIDAAHQVSFVSNFPIVSRNNILVNLGVNYQRQSYQMSDVNSHPFAMEMDEFAFNRANLTLTVFKPLNERNFILTQLQSELNGNYTADNVDISNLRFPLAVLYGWKPSDRLMYAFGLSRTYLGGALNYVPIIYYYHTFKNQKWGIEALLPARAMLRYRFNSLSYMGLGFNVNGATYSMNQAEQPNIMPAVPNYYDAQDLELRRSEIRAGLSYSRQLNGFFWMSVEAGYRINYSFNVDEGGDFTRFFGSEEPYFMENQLANTAYFTVGLSYVSP
ncbi:MAG: DUF6268 family outer membrane beta-barrel protein [Bacteroidetes bacterium]|nr:DUF6268 family outer membrane beta-barrel protein [Bacteroidota bacterium]